MIVPVTRRDRTLLYIAQIADSWLDSALHLRHPAIPNADTILDADLTLEQCREAHALAHQMLGLPVEKTDR